MSSLKFLDKRNDDNSFLRFKVPELNYLITENIFNSIVNYESYKTLEKNLSSKYVSIFFKKKLYQDTTSIASKILINRWNYKYDKNNFKKNISFIKRPYFHLIEKLFNSEPFSLSGRKKYSIVSFFKSQKWFYYFYFLKFINFFFKKKRKKKSNLIQTKIGVNYVEGHNFELRNDLFWLNEEIEKNSIVYYCESKNRLKKLSVSYRDIEKLKNSKINFVRLWKWHNLENVQFIEYIKNQISLIKPKDELEKWLIKEIKNFLIQVNFWYCFFKDQNIKIHLNSDEYSLSNVVRQIALNKLGGCSIGKCRSSPRKIEGDWFAYYPNDIFFTWGEDSTEGLIKSKNYFKSLIISGYPYQEKKYMSEDIDKIKKSFRNKGVKFSILISDGSHGKNENDIHQLFPSSSMSEFLNSFFSWLIEDKELGIIIKSKKPGLIDDLNEIQENLAKVKKTGRCVVIDKFGIEPKKFSDIVDFSVGASVDIPTSVIQIAIKGQRGIIYDFSNLSSIEKKLYGWGSNKIIFKNLNALIEKLKDFKAGKAEKNLGDWSDNINYYDSFCDDKGGQRIGEYISDLKLHFDKGHTLNETIKYANSNFKKKWGQDKLKLLEK